MSTIRTSRSGQISGSIVALCSAVILASPLALALDQHGDQRPISEQKPESTGRGSRLPYAQAGDLLKVSRGLALSLPHDAGVLPLRMIAVVHWDGGNEEVARAVFEEATTAARSIELEYARNWALSTIAVSQAEVGAFDLARKTAIAITEPSRLPDVADALQAAGDYAGARLVLQNIPSSDSLFHFRLTELAISQAKAGDINGAQRAARQIDKPYDRDRGLREICTIIAATGNVGDAIELATSIENPSSQKSAKRSIAVVLARRATLMRPLRSPVL